jgi:transposase
METSQLLLLGNGLELTGLEMGKGQLVLHITATSRSSPCPVCAQPATRLHSRYSRVVKDLPCVGQQVQLILHVRKFFCDTAQCVRKIFAERRPQLVAPWAQMTTRLRQAMQDIGLARLRQTRSTVGLAPGDGHVVDDDCSPRYGEADQASSTGAVSGH